MVRQLSSSNRSYQEDKAVHLRLHSLIQVLHLLHLLQRPKRSRPQAQPQLTHMLSTLMPLRQAMMLMKNKKNYHPSQLQWTLLLLTLAPLAWTMALKKKRDKSSRFSQKQQQRTRMPLMLELLAWLKKKRRIKHSRCKRHHQTHSLSTLEPLACQPPSLKKTKTRKQESRKLLSQLWTPLLLTLGLSASQARNSLIKQLLQQLLHQLQHPPQLQTLMHSILTHLGCLSRHMAL